MDFLHWLNDVGERIWSVFAKPIHQSLILICLTVSVLAAQYTVSRAEEPDTWLTPYYVLLLCLYLVKNVSILLREIKETQNDGPKDLPTANG